MQVRFIRSLLFAVGTLFLSTVAFAQVGISITIAPPALPVYDQPVCPTDGYIWTPGYWAWADGDYYWVPGTWVQAPEIGFLWTPGYWRWDGNAYIFSEGYWGPSVGFYGGIDYGFGYFGHGYEGGRWTNGHFFYNTTVNKVNVAVIHNVYNTKLNEPVNHVSFNGGAGGIAVRATAQEEAASREKHIPPVAAQTQHAQAARSAPEQRFAANHGAPPVAASPRPGDFKDRAVVSAKPVAAAGNSPRPATAIHPKDLPPIASPAPAKTGDPKLDQQYQKQQQQLVATQNQERQKLQQKQDQEHQQLAKQKAPAAKTQQVERVHQQQTQQLQQKHTQQMQQLQQRQQQPAARGTNGSRGERP